MELSLTLCYRGQCLYHRVDDGFTSLIPGNLQVIAISLRISSLTDRHLSAHEQACGH